MKTPRRNYAAEQGLAEVEALKKGMEEKSKEFTEKGSELYAKARSSLLSAWENLVYPSPNGIR